MKTHYAFWTKLLALLTLLVLARFVSHARLAGPGLRPGTSATWPPH